MPTSPVLAVTFDWGHTLCDLDTAMLSQRLAERGLDVPEDRLEAAVAEAKRAYDAAIVAGHGGDPWKSKMHHLLVTAGAPSAALVEVVDWLWTEQPRRSLWRRPIPGMIELVRGLRSAGFPTAIISNSRGRLSELTAEIGWGGDFSTIVDSAKLGIDKPDPRIFLWASTALDVPPAGVVHVGDSYTVDVEGALHAGMRAVWFRGEPRSALPAEVRIAGAVDEAHAALSAFGLVDR